MAHSYYDTIKNPSTFVQKGRGKANFTTLYQAGDWEGAATRLIHVFPSLPTSFPESVKGMNPCIDGLIDGPRSVAALAGMSEPQLVQQFEPDSLGYVWAALAHFVRGSSSTTAPKTPHPKREVKKPVLYGNFVRPDPQSSPPRPPSSESGSSSLGYVDQLEAPVFEDSTVRLASCFIRCVLNYAQPFDKPGPFVQFRDERLPWTYSLDEKHSICAIDDGGVQLYDSDGTVVQVAQLEGKRIFNTIVEGKPVITDRLLAQMVGEALALRQDTEKYKISSDDVITILAVTHYVSFFHFKITDDFISKFEELPTY
ncbi:hypothetical protein TOPH_04412 [Tolypocladium ophioglossoides CBS 100239]|uniref:Uncharacterized protein n=1 Tax=Tolypocladium ophioglossoides (strain CBS 100239) TaxID=1163406 RepID=A0A0L0NA91_TOLOC|nr:hypothetical protein TOPH_04412 [Tolypocladium ophioglossoides CBS 100239]